MKLDFDLHFIFTWFLIDRIEFSLLLFNYEDKKINYLKEMIGVNVVEIEFIQVKLADGISFYSSFF